MYQLHSILQTSSNISSYEIYVVSSAFFKAKKPKYRERLNTFPNIFCSKSSSQKLDPNSLVPNSMLLITRL